jgi:hypothetical protein
MSCYPASKKQAMEVPLKLNKMAVLMGIGLCHCRNALSLLLCHTNEKTVSALRMDVILQMTYR